MRTVLQQGFRGGASSFDRLLPPSAWALGSINSINAGALPVDGLVWVQWVVEEFGPSSTAEGRQGPDALKQLESQHVWPMSIS